MEKSEMIDDVKLLYNHLIYNQLGLNSIEQEIKDYGVKCKEIKNNENYFLSSQYFFLLNSVHIERLTEEEYGLLQYYISELKKDNNEIQQDLYSFLKKNMMKILLPETNSNYLYYGGNSFQYMAPADALVFGFHYVKFDENYTEEKDLEMENFINSKLNYIQSQLAPSKNMKVAIIKYDNRIKESSMVL